MWHPVLYKIFDNNKISVALYYHFFPHLHILHVCYMFILNYSFNYLNKCKYLGRHICSPRWRDFVKPLALKAFWNPLLQCFSNFLAPGLCEVLYLTYEVIYQKEYFLPEVEMLAQSTARRMGTRETPATKATNATTPCRHPVTCVPLQHLKFCWPTKKSFCHILSYAAYYYQ